MPLINSTCCNHLTHRTLGGHGDELLMTMEVNTTALAAEQSVIECNVEAGYAVCSFPLDLARKSQQANAV